MSNYSFGTSLTGKTKFVPFTLYNGSYNNLRVARVTQTIAEVHNFTLGNFAGTGYDCTKVQAIHMRCYIDTYRGLGSIATNNPINRINVTKPVGFSSTGINENYTFYLGKRLKSGGSTNNNRMYMSGTVIIPFGITDSNTQFEFTIDVTNELLDTPQTVQASVDLLGVTQYV